MEKKVAAFITVLLLSALTAVQFVYLAQANFVGAIYDGEVSPDAETEPPLIVILTPKNNTAYKLDDIALTINITVGNSTTASARLIEAVYYETDWQPNKTYVYERIPDAYKPVLTEYSTTLNLTGVPDGKHTMSVTATERGEYDNSFDIWNNLHYTIFEITGSSSVSFTVDSIPPNVSVLSPENKAVYTSDVSLNFAVNELTSQLLYSLDGQGIVTITGNTTLTGLSNGDHNITIYATDSAGNIGTSETIYFTIEPLSITPIAVASVAIVTVVGVSLLVYFKKRKH